MSIVQHSFDIEREYNPASAAPRKRTRLAPFLEPIWRDLMRGDVDAVRHEIIRLRDATPWHRYSSKSLGDEVCAELDRCEASLRRAGSLREAECEMFNACFARNPDDVQAAYRSTKKESQ